jgi:AcrR family transcriptional regulator
MGRPRSEEAHARVLDAAGELFAAQGIDATSMDAIADASGVSKATIYKHWPDKDALCLEVMSSLHGADAVAALQPSGDVRADLIAALNRQAPKPRSELRARIMPHLIAYAARTPGFGEVWRVRVIDPPRLQVMALLQRAVAEGELSPDLDVEATAVSLLGAMIYRNLLRQTGGHPPDSLVESVVAMVWRAHEVTRASSRVRHKAATSRPHVSSPRA